MLSFIQLDYLFIIFERKCIEKLKEKQKQLNLSLVMHSKIISLN